MSGAVPLLRLCVFMAWTGTTLGFTFTLTAGMQIIVILLSAKGKSKGHPSTGHEGPEGE